MATTRLVMEPSKAQDANEAMETLLGDGDPDADETAIFTAYGDVRRFIKAEHRLLLSEYGIVRILGSASGKFRVLMRKKPATEIFVNDFIIPGTETPDNPELLSYNMTNYRADGTGFDEMLFWRFATPGIVEDFRSKYAEALDANRALITE
jgi:hypothetical protein